MTPSARPQPPSPQPGEIIWALCDIYAGGVFVFLAVRLLVGESWPIVPMLNNLTPWFLLPAVALSVAALLRRRIRRAGFYGALAVVFVALYGELFLPSLAPSSACAADRPGCLVRLRVMQFNFFNDHIDLGRAIPLLRESGADIVAIEEFRRGAAEVFKGRLSDVYPYQVQFRDSIPGIGLISKYPIISAKTFTLVEPALLTHLDVMLDVNGSPLRVIVAHPFPPGIQWQDGLPRYVIVNSADVRGLARKATSGGSTLLMGDFNTVDQSEDYRAIRAMGLRDAFRDAGWGLGVTWPRLLGGLSVPPLVRIDYIWMTPDFTATNAWVGPDAGSDHLPMIADLVWRP